MSIKSVVSLLVLVAIVGACAPSADESGWEVAQKRSDEERMPTFPELPVVLPPTPDAPPAAPSTSGMNAVYSKKLAEGSLFRRGYSVPTP